MKNKDLPAMPFEGGQNNGLQPSTGITKREYFAAHAPDMPNEWLTTQEFTHEEERDDADGVEGVYLRYRLRCMIAWRWHYADIMLEGEK